MRGEFQSGSAALVGKGPPITPNYIQLQPITNPNQHQLPSSAMLRFPAVVQFLRILG